MQADWGLQDKKAVGEVLARVTDQYPHAYGGGSYDADALQYTEWVVEDAEGAAEMRAETKAAFEKVAGESNLTLQFASAPKPLTRGAEVQEQLLRAVRKDPRWPTNLALTGSWDFASGTYLIEAGDRHDDPDVVAYLTTTWDGLVIATATEPNQPQMINTGDGG